MNSRYIYFVTALATLWSTLLSSPQGQERPIIAIDLTNHTLSCADLKEAYVADETIQTTTYARLRVQHMSSIPLEMLMLKSDYGNACSFYGEFIQEYLKNNPSFSSNQDLINNLSSACKKFFIIGFGEPTVFKSPSGQSQLTYYSMIRLRPLINVTHDSEPILPPLTAHLRQASP